MSIGGEGGRAHALNMSWLLASPKAAEIHSPQRCSRCGVAMTPDAGRCSRCGLPREVSPALATEASEAQELPQIADSGTHTPLLPAAAAVGPSAENAQPAARRSRTMPIGAANADTRASLLGSRPLPRRRSGGQCRACRRADSHAPPRRASAHGRSARTNRTGP
jgi:ferredoxin